MQDRQRVRDTQRDIPTRWDQEAITDGRLTALLPYTELGSVEECRATLKTLAQALSHLSVRDSRHLFVQRRGGPTKTEYVLHANPLRLHGSSFVDTKQCLLDLGITVLPVDELLGEYVVFTERGKTTLELLNLVAGYDPDADLDSVGSNWATVAREMERAAREDASEEIPTFQRSHRGFPLRGNASLQRIDPRLKQYFMDAVNVEQIDPNDVELDVLIDDTATRFEEGSVSLEEAFGEWGIDVDEHQDVQRTVVPRGKSLGEVLEPQANQLYRWKKGVLFTRGTSGTFNDASEITNEDLRMLYAKAQPAARLLWDADALRRKAERILAMDTVPEQPNKMLQEILAEAKRKQEKADMMQESLNAIGTVIDIHRGIVFTRVMRFMKRQDVRKAQSYGPQDLMQEGLMGLYRALAKADLDHGNSFIGFARHHIDGLILAYVVRHRTFASIPAHVQGDLNQLYDIETKADALPGVHEENKRIDVHERMARRLELAKSIFGDRYDFGLLLDRKYREAHHESASMVVPLDAIDAEALSAVDMDAQSLVVLPDTRYVDKVDTKTYFSRLLSQVLTPREESVIRYRCGIGPNFEVHGEEKTLEDVGKRVVGPSGDSVTRERIRQIEIKAFRKLRIALVRKLGIRDAQGDKYLDLRELGKVFDVG